MLGKALAAFVPSVIVAYAVFAFFVAGVEAFAQPGIAHAVIRGPELLAQLGFTPLLTGLAIWIGIGISARTNDVRTAQQLSALASLPAVAVTTLIAYKVIHPTPSITVALAAVLIALDRIGWRVTSAALDRERLVTDTK